MGKPAKKFYTKKWFVILSLILFFPLGIFLLWRSKKWTKNTRWVLTLASIIFFIFTIAVYEGEADSFEEGSPQNEETIATGSNEESLDGNHIENENKTNNQDSKNNKQEENNEQQNEENNNEKIEENNKKENKEDQDSTTNDQLQESKTYDGILKTHFINVGQADAILIEYKDQTNSYHILFDTGDWQRKDAIDYLHSIGIQSLDLVVISHPHADHMGQLEYVMKDFQVEEVWMSGNIATSNVFQRALEAVLDSDARYYEPRTGESFSIGPIDIEVVHPNSLTGDLNADSIVARFTFGSIAFLLTGDATTSSEEKMLSHGNINAQILSLGHHGSNTSTSQPFLSGVQPEVAIYSAGNDNQYGHPHAEVVTRIKDENIDLYGTDVHGHIIVETNGDTYQVSTENDGVVTAQTEKKSNHKTENSSSSSTVAQEDKLENEPEVYKEEPVTSGHCVDINSASFEELQEIIHIGPARAGDLEDLRPFQSIDDLTRISGIGPARIKDIQAQGIACVQ